MTCIIGYMTDKEAVIASDTMSINGDMEICSLTHEKIRTVCDNCHVGTSGAYGAGEAFTDIFQEASSVLWGKDMQAEIDLLKTALAEGMRSHPYFRDNDISDESKHFSAIITIPHGLYICSRSQPVLMRAQSKRAVAIGCAREYALGAMAALHGGVCIDRVMIGAMEAVREYCLYVGGNTVIKRTALL